MERINVIDSHTGGEPTRIIVGGGPDLGNGPLNERANIFKQDFDHIRNAVVAEPRGSDVLVGGLLCEPTTPECTAAVIFFNNGSYLGMCGHGTIGLMVTLQYMGKIEKGRHKIETPVGIVEAELSADGSVLVQNVPSYRFQSDVEVDIPGNGRVKGDIAWGGNWFFLVKDSGEELTVENTTRLTQVCTEIRDALAEQGITGANGAYVDHIELFGPALDPKNHSRNFVLCPGGAYDRSPCGTGSSAKLACLAEDGVLAPNEHWRQESIVGSVFVCSYETLGDCQVLPTIRGSAHINGEATLILNPDDPFCMGIKY